MYCQKCNIENPVDARFCKNCGSPFKKQEEVYRPIPMHDFAKQKKTIWFSTLLSILVIVIVLLFALCPEFSDFTYDSYNNVTLPILIPIGILTLLILLMKLVFLLSHVKIYSPEFTYLTSRFRNKKILLTNYRLIVSTRKALLSNINIQDDIIAYCIINNHLRVKLSSGSELYLKVTKPEIWEQAIKLIKNQ